MLDRSAKERFLDSVERCAKNDEFLSAFYQHFFSKSPEIQHKFVGTNFAKQNDMLLRSLRLAAGATAGERESLSELRERAETHDRHHLNISPDLYHYWLEAITETAADFDPNWNDEIGAAWEKVLGYVIKHMIRYY